MTFVYVLISEEKDVFLEQCYISILSLKKHNPSSKIVILTDASTGKRIRDNHLYDIDTLAELIDVEFEKEYSKKIISRLLKISTRQYISGKYVFLDTDTIVTDSLDELNGIKGEINMVLDHHMNISKNISKDFYYVNAKKAGFQVGFDDKHFNSGVMLIEDTPQVREFFDLWRKLYKSGISKGIFNDQPSLNETNARMGGVIKELDGVWNVQLDSGLKYVGDAKILHYFNFHADKGKEKYKDTIPYELYNSELFYELKKEGKVTERIADIINHPKKGFKNAYILSEDCISYKLVQSYVFKILKYIYVKKNRLFVTTDTLIKKIYLKKK